MLKINLTMLILLADIDECAIPDMHNCEHECENTAGSYVCYCNSSYTKTDDGISCLGKF